MKRKIIFISLIFLVLLSLNNIVNASNPDYEIIGYDINIEVNDSNVFNITETIKANFLEDSHGIIREIPINNKIKREDGTISKNYADITNIEINEQYTKKKKDGNIILKIGNSDEIVSGEKEYIIKYSYDLGKDTGITYDELYFNLIGSRWNTTIENITFTIKMPKEFDKTKLGFTSGKEGSKDSTGVTYSVDGNIIKGSLDKKLKNYEAFTIRLELPEGYFENAKSDLGILLYLSFIVPILLIAITFYWWFKYGRDNMVVQTVEFRPPQRLNSATIGLIYKGDVGIDDVTSLLIDLANRGYIKITLDKDDDYTFEKLKEYDGNLEEEREFLKGLFPKTKKIKMSRVVGNFVKTSDKIMQIVRNKKEEYFETNSLNKTFPIFIFCLIIYILTTVLSIEKFMGLNSESLSVIAFNVFGLIVLVSGFYMSDDILGKIITAVIGLGIYAFSSIVIIPILIQDKIYFISHLFGIVSYFILGLFIKIMKKRTEKGNKLYGKILGFRNFLDVAEKEQLEKQVEQNPKYFYDILPYAYVLGLSDVWINKFEAITMNPSDWLVSDKKDINHKVYSSFIGELNTRIGMSIARKNSTKFSGFTSTGGGLSGGGSGGGRTEVLGRK